MLIIMRRKEEEIIIDDNIRIKVLKIEGNQISLGIEAPEEIKIYRAELIEGIKTGDEFIKPDD